MNVFTLIGITLTSIMMQLSLPGLCSSAETLRCAWAAKFAEGAGPIFFDGQ